MTLLEKNVRFWVEPFSMILLDSMLCHWATQDGQINPVASTPRPSIV